MDRPPKEIFDRLGAAGLVRALDDVLDQGQLIRLAGACGVKYRGMRTQSQSRERLLSDVVDRSGKHEDARKAILRVLEKETGKAGREWGALKPEEKAQRLCDEKFLRADGNLGVHLFLLASRGDPEELQGFADRFAHEHLVRLAANGGPARPEKTSREATRLKRRTNELEKKVKHLEAQLGKSRESQKASKRDLIQRKGELAESRMLTERLRRDLESAQARVASEKGRGAADSDPALDELTKAMRKMASQQKKLQHVLENPPVPKPPRKETTGLAPLSKAIDQLAARFDEQHAADRKELAAQAKRLEELRLEIRSQAATRDASRSKPSRRSRIKRQEQRVGVFIDVQNMYYAARQLKGKLDFDALMEAALNDRRLIQATAYVVESKETDQSQFIAMLEQRAIQVQRKALRIRADGSMKGDWDMELALDVLDAASNLDVVVLVSGDGDFTSLVKRVKAMGPRVEVIAFPRNTAKALVEAADHYQPLDRKFMIYAKHGKTTPRKAPDPARTAKPTRRAPEASAEAPARPQATPSGTSRERAKTQAS